MSLSTGTTLGSTFILVPSNFMSSSDSILRASMCLCCRMEVSRKYNLYESPIQRNRDVMKAGLNAGFVQKYEGPNSARVR